MTETRLIAPVTEGWNRGECDWTFVKDASADIAHWEETTGHSLPGDYRRFMLRFNGGRVYPRLFRYTVPLERYPSTEPETMVNPFYPWDRVMRYSEGEVYGAGTPADMLFIGCDPGALELLLSLRPADRGAIFCWIHTVEPWGEGENTEVWRQADSFQAFIDSLYDLADGSDRASWHVPGYDKIAVPLVF